MFSGILLLAVLLANPAKHAKGGVGGEKAAVFTRCKYEMSRVRKNSEFSYAFVSLLSRWNISFLKSVPSRFSLSLSSKCLTRAKSKCQELD